MAGRFTVEAVFKAIDNFSRPIDQMKRRMGFLSKEAARGLGDVDRAAGRIVSSMNKAGLAAAAGGVAVGVGLAAAAKPGMDFEQQMANLGAVSLQTRDQLVALEKEALRLGAATQFSATEAAAGMEVMAKAGFTNEEILAGIGGMMYAAAAAGEELAATTANVSSVMKGMGLETREAQRVADVLALASVRTNSSISSLGESMSKVSSTARQLGVPLEDTVAMVALLEDVGLDASEAGSAVATMLTMMSKPTDTVAAKMRKMGVSFKDAAGNMKSPAEVLGQLVKAGEKAGGNMDQVAFFADLVGMRGQKAAVNLKDLFAAGKVTTLVDELKMAAGTAQKMSDLRMNTLTGDLDVLGESIKSNLIGLFSETSGPLRDAAQGMTKWVDANQDAIRSGFKEYLTWTLQNLPLILDRLVMIGKAVVAFYAMAAAVKVATTAIRAYLLAAKAFGLVRTMIRWTAIEMGLFNVEVAAGQKGLAGLRAGLNAGALSSQINGVTSKLGKAGLLGAALAVGYAFGSWLDHQFGISDMLSNWLAKLTGINAELDKAGGRAQKRGLGGGGGKFYDGTHMVQMTDGTVVDTRTGKIVNKLGGPASLTDQVFSVPETLMSGEDDMLSSGPQLVSPQERIAHTISESNSMSTGELTIRDETGRAELTKAPKPSGFGISLVPSGAF